MIAAKVASLLELYGRRGGEHPAVAIFADVDNSALAWQVHIGNGRCQHVRLGEVDGEYIGEGATIEDALFDVEAKLT